MNENEITSTFHVCKIEIAFIDWISYEHLYHLML